MDCKNFSFLEQNHDFIGSVIIHSPGKKKMSPFSLFIVSDFD